MSHPILVTGAAGRVGGIGRAVAEMLLKRGKPVRAMVRSDDKRARALRDIGAEVVTGDLLDLDSMHRAIADCEAMYFGKSVSDDYLAATVNAAAVAKHYGVKAFVNMSQMTLSQMNINETTPSPQHKLHWLAEQALNWSGLPVVHVRPTVLLEGFFLIFTPDSVRESNEIRLPFGNGKTSPVSVEDVARVVTALLDNPDPHIGKTYHLTGPQSENMQFFAQEYSEALGRRIVFRDIPVGPWRDSLLERGLPVHLVSHITTMADLHRAGRYDRMSEDVFALTGEAPMSVRTFVGKYSESFNPAAKVPESQLAAGASIN
ncbi:MAG TPA: SDR family NAD(P)-dependent oxidoreductase [Bryobacteraceae bacterium]|nr:SDR family NAD(P)-dependent oxidoreductase [Bryobacteraceae bacterium]